MHDKEVVGTKARDDIADMFIVCNAIEVWFLPLRCSCRGPVQEGGPLSR